MAINCPIKATVKGQGPRCGHPAEALVPYHIQGNETRQGAILTPQVSLESETILFLITDEAKEIF
jgi:hypothetical protein